MSHYIDLLIKIGEETRDIIVADIERQHLIKTGTLRDSIDFNIQGNELHFTMVDYGKFLDEGTIYISPREFFTKHIEEQLEKYHDELEEALANDLYDELE